MHYNCRSAAEAWNTAMLSYQHWNPRIGEIASYFLGHHAEYWFLFLHPVLTFAATLFIYRLGIGSWPKSEGKSILSLLFVFITIMGYASLWFLGNLNWLYPCTAALGLLCLTEPFFKGSFKISTGHTLLALPLAFITGMSNDNTPIVVWILLSACGVFHYLIKKESRPGWQYITILLTLSAACCLYYLAPGTYERAQDADWELSFRNILFNSILAPGNWIFIVVIMWRLIASSVILGALRCRLKCPVDLGRLSIIWATLLLLWGVLLAAPCWGAPRSFSTLEIALTCIMAHVFAGVINKLSLTRSWLILLLHTAILSTQIIPVIGGAVSSQREWNRIVTIAEQAKAAGQDFVIIRKSQLDFTPTFPQIMGLPGTIFNYRILPTIPLIPCSEEQTKHTSHKHKWIESIGTNDSGDHIMNPIAAKKLGLKAVYYLADK